MRGVCGSEEGRMLERMLCRVNAAGSGWFAPIWINEEHTCDASSKNGIYERHEDEISSGSKL